MAIELLDLELVVERIKAQVAGLKHVGGSADFMAAFEGGPLVPPSVFVVPLSERPGNNEQSTGVSQRDTVTVGVVHAIRNLRDAVGREAHAELLTWRGLVMTALLGWTPDPEQYDVFVFAPGGGRLLMFKDQVLWWQDDFATALYLRT